MTEAAGVGVGGELRGDMALIDFIARADRTVEEWTDGEMILDTGIAAEGVGDIVLFDDIVANFLFLLTPAVFSLFKDGSVVVFSFLSEGSVGMDEVLSNSSLKEC